ncbi:MAG: T9SS type A sorting domain-containing protein [Ignavibacteriaceae bacterium]|nr:T9SS type A sorting domain-containing protein [Ignavibacteriaceae bacterium]HRN26562.1 T9SS type A sorting domain-containing protein [Ignavibacteriaceae bacterium]HRP91815.1 T9SS type A sorting domain-containing protein [Ignavibacteriaceae bacterium]HRQ53936.1 T9SS type A sorting domain-containing protein [Ignavibacteriaceae bacterium]
MQTKKQISSLSKLYSLLWISSYIKLKTVLLVTFFTFNTLAQTPQWQFMGLAGEEIYDIAVDDSGNVYVASWTGIFKSTDNGVSWEFKNNGLQIGDVYKLFIDYAGYIYLCGSANYPGFGLYKSTDGGENWVGFADTLNGGPINNFEDVTVIPNEPGGFIYVSNYYGVYRSADNGITWQSTNYTDPCARFIGINKNGYMFFGNLCASWFGIYRSTDLGSNWERHTLLGIDAMIYLKDGSVLASAYDPGLGSCGVYKTIDNGANWVNTNTFSNLSCPIDFVLDTNDDIYAAVGYVFISSNNGISWSNYGLPGQGAFKLAIDSSGYIWSGNHLDGVYKTPGRTIPVELVSFAAELNNNNVLLSWVTASEINNQGFQIERRETKNEEWINIGFVNGKVTTTEPQAYTFVDKNLETGKYQYRLKQIDFDGTYEYTNTIEVEINSPTKFSLEQNYPNPFNPETNIDYMLPIETIVNISLYDITGRMIKELVNEKKQPGYYTVKLKGDELSSGIYFYRLFTTSGYAAVKKISVIK